MKTERRSLAKNKQELTQYMRRSTDTQYKWPSITERVWIWVTVASLLGIGVLLAILAGRLLS